MSEKIVAVSPCPSCKGTNVYAVRRRGVVKVADPTGRSWFCPDCLYYFGRAWKNDPLGVFFPATGYYNNPKVVKVLKDAYERHNLRVGGKN